MAGRRRSVVAVLQPAKRNQRQQQAGLRKDLACHLLLASASRKQCGNAGLQQRSQERRDCSNAGPCTDSLQQADFGQPVLFAELRPDRFLGFGCCCRIFLTMSKNRPASRPFETHRQCSTLLSRHWVLATETLRRGREIDSSCRCYKGDRGLPGRSKYRGYAGVGPEEDADSVFGKFTGPESGPYLNASYQKQGRPVQSGFRGGQTSPLSQQTDNPSAAEFHRCDVLARRNGVEIAPAKSRSYLRILA